MSLEIMQMKMNNIADNIDTLAQSLYWKSEQLDVNDETQEKHDRLMGIGCMLTNIACIIREEMKIEHY